MKVKKMYAEFIIKFPKFKSECLVVFDYENKYFLVYFGNELTDEDYAELYSSLRKRFKVDDYTCKLYHLSPGDIDFVNPKYDIKNLISDELIKL